jgi:hypothetical protein
VAGAAAGGGGVVLAGLELSLQAATRRPSDTARGSPKEVLSFMVTLSLLDLAGISGPCRPFALI